MAGAVDPEIARDRGRIVEDAAHGKAFGDEPVMNERLDLGLVFRCWQIHQVRRGDARAGDVRQPVLREHLPRRRIEGARQPVVDEGGIGDELGMLFPFEAELAEIAEEMRGVRFGMLRAEAVQQREQMRAVPPAVPAWRPATAP